MNAGQRIANLRKRRGMNQQQLAQALNVSPSTVAMWEINKRALKDDTIKMLSEFFGVSADYLLGIEKKSVTDEPKTKPETIAAHIDDDVSEDEMEDIINYIDFIKQKHSKRKE